MVPRVHRVPVDAVGAQLRRCSLAVGYAAGLPQSLPADINSRRRSRHSHLRKRRHCRPAHVHQVGAGSALERVQPLVPAFVTPPVSLAGPGRLAVLTAVPIVVRAAPTLPCVSRFRLPSASPGCCDRQVVGSFIPPGIAAPHGALNGRCGIRLAPRDRRPAGAGVGLYDPRSARGRPLTANDGARKSHRRRLMTGPGGATSAPPAINHQAGEAMAPRRS